MPAPRPRMVVPVIIAYRRVSTDEQTASGAGLAAQQEAIARYSAQAALEVDHWLTDEGVSGSLSPADRPQLREALRLLRAAHAGVLIVAKPDRLTRKTRDLLVLRDTAEREGWSLASADGSIDMMTPHGRAMASVMGTFAELERDLISERTRLALAAKKASGVRLGRPGKVPDSVKARIAMERSAGMTLAQIADCLTAEGIPTAGNGATASGKEPIVGKRWYPSTVRGVLRSIDNDRVAATSQGNIRPTGDAQPRSVSRLTQQLEDTIHHGNGPVRSRGAKGRFDRGSVPSVGATASRQSS